MEVSWFSANEQSNEQSNQLTHTHTKSIFKNANKNDQFSTIICFTCDFFVAVEFAKNLVAIGWVREAGMAASSGKPFEILNISSDKIY